MIAYDFAVQMNHNLFNHSPTDRQNLFPGSYSMDNAVINISALFLGIDSYS